MEAALDDIARLESGTQFTCFSSTQVQILTPEEAVFFSFSDDIARLESARERGRELPQEGRGERETARACGRSLTSEQYALDVASLRCELEEARRKLQVLSLLSLLVQKYNC